MNQRMKREHGARCGNCKYRHHGECYFNPPVVVSIPVVVADGKVIEFHRCDYKRPGVARDDPPCHEFKRSLESETAIAKAVDQA